MTSHGPRRALWALTLLIALAGVMLRLRGLSVQPYWVDEIFSVQQSDEMLGHVLAVGRTEVHPPTYAFLLWGWMRLASLVVGTPDAVWVTHLLSALFACAGVLTSWTALRRSHLSELSRALIVIATACSGFALAYGQETRSYSLLWWASVGLTAATLRWVAEGAEAPTEGATAAETRERRSARLPWLGWALLASATHLFGAVLTLGAALTVALLRRPAWRRAALFAVVGVVPQAAWLIFGVLCTPKFADGAKWAPAPDPAAVGQLLIDVFPWGRLQQVEDGFYFASPAVLWVLTGLVAAAVVLRTVRGRAGLDATRAAEAGSRHTGGTKSADMLALRAATLLAVGTMTGTYVVSQVEHLWLLRNMIVVAPALSWAAVLAVHVLTPGRRPRAALTAAAVAALVASLGSSALAQATPYKSGFRDALLDIVAFRQQHPDGFVEHNVDTFWALGTSIPRTDEAFGKILLPGQRISPTSFPKNVIPKDGPVLVVGMDLHMSEERNQARADEVMDRLGRDRCHRLPHKDVTVVWCEAG